MKIMVISKKTLIWAATVLLVIVAAIAFAVFPAGTAAPNPTVRPEANRSRALICRVRQRAAVLNSMNLKCLRG